MNKYYAALVGPLLAAAVLVSLMPLMIAAQRGRGAAAGAPAAAPPVRRTADGKPDFTGLYQANAGGANYGLEQRRSTERLTPSTNGVIVDPPDGKLPYQAWARAE